MYLGFYKLKEMPFRQAPDSNFMYWSAGHAAALDCIRAAQKSLHGCAVIIGERGAGKTGLLEYLYRSSTPDTAMRIDFPPRTLSELAQWLRESQADDESGARTIFCDNAHLFHETMLAALLAESSLELAPARASCVVLAGEPGLAHSLDNPLRAAVGRARHQRFKLPPLTAAEVMAYIEHRLSVAGANGARIFRDETCVEIHRQTRGNPRLVNALCDAAMVIACERGLSEVGPTEVRCALEDIGRLVALQADDRVASAPRGQTDDPQVASIHSVFARLRLMRGGQIVLERELAHGSLSIGRSASNDLCIASRYVSRQHCRIITREHRCILEDVHSTNGLYVNEKRVLRHRMRDGDVVQIGEHRLHYVDLRSRAAPA